MSDGVTVPWSATPEQFAFIESLIAQYRAALTTAKKDGESLLDAAAGLVIMRGQDCDRVVAEKIQALKGKPCTCGSGGHPYKCERHPFAYDAHVRELNIEAELANRAEDAESALEKALGALRAALYQEGHCEMTTEDRLLPPADADNHNLSCPSGLGANCNCWWRLAWAALSGGAHVDGPRTDSTTDVNDARGTRIGHCALCGGQHCFEVLATDDGPKAQ